MASASSASVASSGSYGSIGSQSTAAALAPVVSNSAEEADLNSSFKRRKVEDKVEDLEAECIAISKQEDALLESAMDLAARANARLAGSSAASSSISGSTGSRASSFAAVTLSSPALPLSAANSSSAALSSLSSFASSISSSAAPHGHKRKHDDDDSSARPYQTAQWVESELVSENPRKNVQKYGETFFSRIVPTPPEITLPNGQNENYFSSSAIYTAAASASAFSSSLQSSNALSSSISASLASLVSATASASAFSSSAQSASALSSALLASSASPAVSFSSGALLTGAAVSSFSIPSLFHATNGVFLDAASSASSDESIGADREASPVSDWGTFPCLSPIRPSSHSLSSRAGAGWVEEVIKELYPAGDDQASSSALGLSSSAASSASSHEASNLVLIPSPKNENIAADSGSASQESASASSVAFSSSLFSSQSAAACSVSNSSLVNFSSLASSRSRWDFHLPHDPRNIKEYADAVTVLKSLSLEDVDGHRRVFERLRPICVLAIEMKDREGISREWWRFFINYAFCYLVSGNYRKARFFYNYCLRLIPLRENQAASLREDQELIERVKETIGKGYHHIIKKIRLRGDFALALRLTDHGLTLIGYNNKILLFHKIECLYFLIKGQYARYYYLRYKEGIDYILNMNVNGGELRGSSLGVAYLSYLLGVYYSTVLDYEKAKPCLVLAKDFLSRTPQDAFNKSIFDECSKLEKGLPDKQINLEDPHYPRYLAYYYAARKATLKGAFKEALSFLEEAKKSAPDSNFVPSLYILSFDIEDKLKRQSENSQSASASLSLSASSSAALAVQGSAPAVSGINSSAVAEAASASSAALSSSASSSASATVSSARTIPAVNTPAAAGAVVSPALSASAGSPDGLATLLRAQSIPKAQSNPQKRF